jgi:hypothetical protein
MKQPVVVGVTNPQIIFDTTRRYTTLGEANMLITDQYAEIKILGLKKKVDFIKYEDFTKSPKLLVETFLSLAIFLLPSIIVWLFIIQFLKYSLIIAVVGLIGWLFAKIMRYDMTIIRSYVVAIYASTIMVFLDTILMPFNLGKAILQIPLILTYGISLITVLIFLTIYVIALVLVGNQEYQNLPKD